MIPDIGPYYPSIYPPLGGRIPGCRGDGLTLVATGQRANQRPIGGTPPSAVVGRQDGTPGCKVASYPRHKAWYTCCQEISDAEPGVDDEHFIGLQGRARLRDSTAL